MSQGCKLLQSGTGLCFGFTALGMGALVSGIQRSNRQVLMQFTPKSTLKRLHLESSCDPALQWLVAPSAVVVELWQLGGLLLFLVCSPSASYASALSTFLPSSARGSKSLCVPPMPQFVGWALSTHPACVSGFSQLAGPCMVLAEAGARVSSCHQRRNPRGGRFLRQSYLLMCLSMGICWRGRATRALLSDLRGIWLENVWFCSRLGAI